MAVSVCDEQQLFDCCQHLFLPQLPLPSFFIITQLSHLTFTHTHRKLSDLWCESDLSFFLSSSTLLPHLCPSVSQGCGGEVSPGEVSSSLQREEREVRRDGGGGS